MSVKTSESIFYLVDTYGHRRLPKLITAKDGRFGYAVHPPGKSNDASAATYTEDEKVMVQAVVLHGRGVRSIAQGGAHDGQLNTLGLSGPTIRGYWLCPSKTAWVAGSSLRPVNEVLKA